MEHSDIRVTFRRALRQKLAQDQDPRSFSDRRFGRQRRPLSGGTNGIEEFPDFELQAVAVP
jgi:hypothetical protein